MMIIENYELVFRIREMARSGHNTISILKFLVEELNLNENSRMIMIIYFQEAFALRLSEAKHVGAWEFFNGGTWNSEMMEAEFGPLLERFCSSMR